VRDGNEDDDVNPSRSHSVFDFGGCCAVKLRVARVVEVELRSGGSWSGFWESDLEDV
jgi:hypothetical protein